MVEEPEGGEGLEEEQARRRRRKEVEEEEEEEGKDRRIRNSIKKEQYCAESREVERMIRKLYV